MRTSRWLQSDQLSQKSWSLFGEHNLINLWALTMSSHITRKTRQYHIVLGTLVSRPSEFTNPLITQYFY